MHAAYFDFHEAKVNIIQIKLYIDQVVESLEIKQVITYELQICYHYVIIKTHRAFDRINELNHLLIMAAVIHVTNVSVMHLNHVHRLALKVALLYLVESRNFVPSLCKVFQFFVCAQVL